VSCFELLTGQLVKVMVLVVAVVMVVAVVVVVVAVLVVVAVAVLVVGGGACVFPVSLVALWAVQGMPRSV
jgi:hypothetical protein